jgi:hypothetical protein
MSEVGPRAVQKTYCWNRYTLGGFGFILRTVARQPSFCMPTTFYELGQADYEREGESETNDHHTVLAVRYNLGPMLAAIC